MQPAAKRVAAVDADKEIDDEIAKFKSIRQGVFAEGPSSRFYEHGIFNQKRASGTRTARSCRCTTPRTCPRLAAMAQR